MDDWGNNTYDVFADLSNYRIFHARLGDSKGQYKLQGVAI